MSTLGVLARILARTREQRGRAARAAARSTACRPWPPTPAAARPFARRAEPARPRQRHRRVQAALAVARRDPRGPPTPSRWRRPTRSAGAAALSVLTEEQFFGGSLDDLKEARGGHPAARRCARTSSSTPTRCGRRWLAGADAMLLIVAALSDAELRTLLATAREAGLDALVEVHDREELERALAAGARHRRRQQPRPAHHGRATCRPRSTSPPHIPDDVVAVAESGINGPARHAPPARRGLRRLPDRRAPDAAAGSRGRAGGADARHAPRALAGRRRADRAGGGEDLRHHAPSRTGCMAARRGRRRHRASCSGRRARAAVDASSRAAPSPRPAAVRPARGRVRGRDRRTRCAQAADAVGLDVLQLHGERAAGGLRAPAAPRGQGACAWAPASARRRRCATRAARRASSSTRALEGGAAGRHRRAPSTGRWSRAVRERASFLVLAGGLTPDNVGRGDRARCGRTPSTSRAAWSRRPGRRTRRRCARSSSARAESER